jgi:hypothetical protein
MRVSSGVLQRHLDRTGRTGTIVPGMSFNFFSPRYQQAPGQRVAIVIPTKNHGELVRQCIDSLHATIAQVDYDIVLIDHESTDPASLAYFATLAPEVTVLRYAGPFNFSATPTPITCSVTTTSKPSSPAGWSICWPWPSSTM